VVVYGSVARGDPTLTSDLDMLIVARDLPLSRRARNQMLVELEDELTSMLATLYQQGIVTEISSKIKTIEEAGQFTPLYLDLTEDAVILYDRDGFFQGVLDRLRQKLDALSARVIVHSPL